MYNTLLNSPFAKSVHVKWFFEVLVLIHASLSTNAVGQVEQPYKQEIQNRLAKKKVIKVAIPLATITIGIFFTISIHFIFIIS